MTADASKNAKAESPVVSVRVRRELLDELDQYIARQEYPPSRADVFLKGVRMVLDAEERRRGRGAPRGGVAATGGAG